MKKITDKKIGQVFLDLHLIDKDQLDHALEIHRRTGGYLGEILLEKGYITEKNLAYAFTLQFGQKMDFVNLEKVDIDPKTAKAIPFEFMERYRVVPIAKYRKVLTIAIAGIENLEDVIDKLYKIIDVDVIEILVSTHKQIFKALAKRYYEYGKGW